MPKCRLFRSPTLTSENTENSAWISEQKGLYLASLLPQMHEESALKAGIFSRVLVAWYDARSESSKGIGTATFSFHGSLLWLHEALSASPMTLLPEGRSPLTAGPLPDTLRPSQTRGAADHIVGAMMPGLPPSQSHLSEVTWAFSSSCVKVRAESSATQTHSSSDQNGMIWKDVALKIWVNGFWTYGFF